MVGSAITRNLISQGYTNLVFTPFPPFDLTNQKIVAGFFEKEKPEYVFLAAARVGGIMSNNTYRAQFLYENLMIQNNIIHQSYLQGVKKLLFLGSSCIYPRNCSQPIREEFLLTGELEFTNEPYAVAKIAGIKMCESYNIQYGTNFISVMPTNLYGPNDNYNLETSHVLPALIRKMHLGKCLENHDWEILRKDLKKNPIEGVNNTASETDIIEKLEKYGIQYSRNTQPCEIAQSPRSGYISQGQHTVSITLWGTGNPYREFLYVDDLADACIFVMNHVNFLDLNALSSVLCADIKNTHINIGTGQDLTILELAQMIKSIVGFKGQLNWDNSKPDGTYRKLLDVSKINRLGWKEKIDLTEGIKMVYNKYST
jgi:GDP-L-fucose synthase